MSNRILVMGVSGHEAETVIDVVPMITAVSGWADGIAHMLLVLSVVDI